MSIFWNRLREMIRREKVLAIAASCALISMLFVPPSRAYADYIDLRVLCLLFCLMAVVAALQSCRVFETLAQRMVGGNRQLREYTRHSQRDQPERIG